MSRWSDSTDVARGRDYDLRWKRLEQAGESVHGEADLVEALLSDDGAGSVLDAGCGTGRVAIELARRGIDVVGVDLDPVMLASARDKAPHLDWVHGDLSRIDLGQRFEVAVMAGNVMIFVASGTEAAVIANLARHLVPDGLLVVGFQLGAALLRIDRFDDLAQKAGLALVHRWATWDREPFTGGGYAVSVHRRCATLA